MTIILYRSLLFIYLSFLYYSSESSCTFTPLNVRLDLGLVISFCVTASSDNYSIQDFQIDAAAPGGTVAPWRSTTAPLGKKGILCDNSGRFGGQIAGTYVGPRAGHRRPNSNLREASDRGEWTPASVSSQRRGLFSQPGRHRRGPLQHGHL